MPIYEYQCNACGKITEVLTRSGDTGDAVTCGSCGSSNMKKMPSVTTIPSFPAPKAGKTCCGRDEKCGGPSCCGS